MTYTIHKQMSADLNDKEIQELIANENVKGLELLYQKYFPIAAKSAFYITKDRDIAEDLAQDVFLKLWKKKDSINQIQNFKGYILTSARNLALDQIEKNNSLNKRHEEYFELQFKSSFENDNDQNINELKKEIEVYVNELPPKCRLIFSLNRFEGLSNDEIAEYLDLSKRTVETQISNALKVLRKKMKSKVGKYFVSATIIVLLFVFIL